MLESMRSLAERSVMERALLFVNHVVGAEPAALERLRPHAGRTLRVEFLGWPSMLPPLGPFAFRVTAAGLFEWLAGSDLPPDLSIAVDVPNPAAALSKLMSGEKPSVAVSGDAAFASDLNWLVDNVRWDAEGDLARFIGDGPARAAATAGAAVASALREAVRTLRPGARRPDDPAAASAGR